MPRHRVRGGAASSECESRLKYHAAIRMKRVAAYALVSIRRQIFSQTVHPPG